MRTGALREIARVVGEDGVVSGTETEPLLRDERGLYRGRAALVVRPTSTRECAEVVGICSRARGRHGAARRQHRLLRRRHTL